MCSEYGQYMNANCHLCGHWTHDKTDFKYKCHSGICPDMMRQKNDPNRLTDLLAENQRLRDRITYLECKLNN